MIKNIILFCLVVFTLSCKSEQDKDSEIKFSNAKVSYLSNEISFSKSKNHNNWVGVDFNDKENDTNQNIITKKIIKDGEITLLSNNIEESKKMLNDLCSKYNAYFGSENLDNDENSITYNLYVRIPADKFELFVSNLENGDNEIQNKSINVRDVTSDFFDLETRLKTKKEYLKKYTELLSRAKTVADILEIEENIRVLQEEIESTEGSFKLLKDKIAFSNLQVEIVKKKEFIYKPGQQDKFFERVKKSLHNGWISIVDFLIWSITLWPYLILFTVVILIFKRIRKKRRSKIE